MKGLLLFVWVVSLIAVVHATTLAHLDLSSYGAGLAAVGLVWVIRWDDLP